MNAKLRRYYERSQRCERVNDSRVEDFPTNSKWAALAATVKERNAAVAALDVEKANSTGKRQQGTAGRRDVREELSELVDSVERTAEAIAVDHPDIKGMFERPAKDRSDRTLIATARSYADRAAPLVGLFVEYSLPATFINDLRSKAEGLESYISLQNEGVGSGVNVNASVNEHIEALNEALERLNVIYHNKYRDDPAVLAEWDSAFHLEAAPGSRRKRNGAPPPDGQTPTPPPTNT